MSQLSEKIINIQITSANYSVLLGIIEQSIERLENKRVLPKAIQTKILSNYKELKENILKTQTFKK